MKFSIRNVALAFGFLIVGIFSSILSTLVGGDSIRAGLILSVTFFYLLVLPFGIRYFMTSKIVIANVVTLLLLSIFYFISTIFFSGSDDFRFLLSIVLLLLMSFGALGFITTLDALKEEFFHKTILFGFYFLMVLGYLGFGLFEHFTPGNRLFFREPSHFAIVLIPFLFYVVYTCGKKPYELLHIMAALVLALTIKSLVLVLGCLFIIFTMYGRQISLFSFIFIILFIVSFFLDLEYFFKRINFSDDNHNLSVLVFLSGWERSYLSFIDSYGFGIGFQQLGILGPEGERQILMENIFGSISNIKDGGSLGSKLIAETGFLGIILLMLFLYNSLGILRRFMLRKITGSKNIFFLAIYLCFFIELFVRGMGYFSLTSFLFLSSVYWIYRCQIFQRDLNLPIR